MLNTKRQRLDTLLVERGLAESRAQAQRLIYAAQVKVAGQTVSKPAQVVRADAPVAMVTRPRFVSRGGEKLDHALNFFALNVKDKICLDVGASTGGFADCLLQRGAGKVFAVDVGLSQLHWKLRQDKRVVILDNTNARYLTSAQFPERPELAAVDVAFISLTKVLPAVINVVAAGGVIITLVKPQFEARRNENKHGVVKNPEVHRRILGEIKCFGEQELGLRFKGWCESPLKGPAGNVEFFICWLKP